MSKGADTTSVNADPWDKAIPYMEGGFKEAQNLYNEYSPEYYTGQTQAGFSPDQLTAQQGVRDFATKGAPSIMNPAMSAYQQGTSSNMLDVANNPYVNNMAQAAADRAMGSLTPQMANIRGGAIMSGQAYGQGLGHQANTLGMTGSLMNAGFNPYQQLGASGGQQQGREQALIRDAQARHQFEQNQPYDKFSKYQQGITGFSPLVPATGQQVSTTPGNSFMSNLGGLAQAGSLMGIGF